MRGKSILLGMLLLGFVAIGGARTVAQGALQADDTDCTTGACKLKGNVRLKIGEYQILADEADLDLAKGVMAMRGNVRVVLPSANAR